MRTRPRYFPLERGLYEVGPGLRTLGTDFGNGAWDERLFQLDDEFSRYRENSVRARAERLSKYVVESALPAEVAEAAARLIVERLVTEYPGDFRARTDSAGTLSLACARTSEELRFDPRMKLVDVTGGPLPPYRNAFDALTAQVPEDLALIVRRDERDWLAALSLRSPSHWAAEDKIGRDFFSIHAPVPGIAKLNHAAARFVDAMIEKGPYVRFVWGFATDRRLNHHPEPAPGEDPVRWKGRAFSRDADTGGADTHGTAPFQLRVERQVTWGLPSVDAAIFTIRVSFVDGAEIRANPDERRQLRSALLSMTPESLAYKGLDADRDAIIAWLDEAET